MSDVCINSLRNNRKETLPSSYATPDVTHAVFIAYYMQMVQKSTMTAINEQHSIFLKLALSGQLDDSSILYWIQQSSLSMNDSLLVIATKAVKSKIIASNSLQCLVEATLGIHVLSRSILTDPILSNVKIMVDLLQDRLSQKEAAAKPVLSERCSRMAQVFSIETFKLHEIDVDLSSIIWLSGGGISYSAISASLTVDVLFRLAVAYTHQHCSDDNNNTIQIINQVSLDLYNIIHKSCNGDSSMNELCGALNDVQIAVQDHCEDTLSMVLLQLSFLSQFLLKSSDGSENQLRQNILWKYASFLVDKLVWLRTAVECESVHQRCRALLRSASGNLGTTTFTAIDVPDQVVSTGSSPWYRALWSVAGDVLGAVIEIALSPQQQAGQITHWGALLQDSCTQQSLSATTTAVIHPGLINSAVKSLLGERAPDLRASWQCKNGVQSAGWCLLPLLALNTAMHTAIEQDILIIDSKQQHYGTLNLPHVLQFFESIRQSWWAADPAASFQLFFDTCCHMLQLKAKAGSDEVCASSVSSLMVRCLVFVSKLLRLAPRDALIHTTLRSPTDWTTLSPEAAVVCEEDKTPPLGYEQRTERALQCKEEEALQQRALGTPHALLRSALFLECVRNIRQQKHFDELSQWLASAHKADLAETALLLRDLCYLTRKGASYCSSTTLHTLTLLITPLRNRKVSNLPSARLWQSILADGVNSLVRLASESSSAAARGGTAEDELSVLPPQPLTEKTAFWLAVAELEKHSYDTAIQHTAEQAVLGLINPPTSATQDASRSDYRVSLQVLNSLSTLRATVVSDCLPLQVDLGSIASAYIEKSDELFVALFAPAPPSGNVLHYSFMEQQMCPRQATSKVRTGPLSAAKLELMLSNLLSSRNLSAVPAVNCVELTFVLIHAAYSTVRAIDSSAGHGHVSSEQVSDIYRHASVVLVVDTRVLEVISAHSHLIVVPAVAAALREHLQQLLHYCNSHNLTQTSFSPSGSPDSPYWISRRYIAATMEILLQLQLPPLLLLDAVSSIFDQLTLTAMWKLLFAQRVVFLLAVFPVLEIIAQCAFAACMAEASCLLSNVVVTAPLWALLSAAAVQGLCVLDDVVPQERCENMLEMCAQLASSLLCVSVSTTDASLLQERTCTRSISPLWLSPTVSTVEYRICGSVEGALHSARLSCSSSLPPPASFHAIVTGAINGVSAVLDGAGMHCPPFALSLESLAGLLYSTPEMVGRGVSGDEGDYSAVAQTTQGLVERVQRALLEGWSSQELGLVSYVASVLVMEDPARIPTKLLQVALHARDSCCVVSDSKEIAVAFLAVLLVRLRHSTATLGTYNSADRVECSGDIGVNSVLTVLVEHIKTVFSIALATKSSTATATVRCEAVWAMEVFQFVGIDYVAQQLQQQQSIEQCAMQLAHALRIASQLRVSVPAHLRRVLLLVSGHWLHSCSSMQEGTERDCDANSILVPKHVTVVLKFLLQTCSAPQCRLEHDLQTACIPFIRDLSSVIRTWKTVLERTAALKETRALRVQALQALSSQSMSQEENEASPRTGASRSASPGLDDLALSRPSLTPLSAAPHPTAAALALARSCSTSSLNGTPPASKRLREMEGAGRSSEKKPSIAPLSEKARKKHRSSSGANASTESKKPPGPSSRHVSATSCPPSSATANLPPDSDQPTIAAAPNNIVEATKHEVPLVPPAMAVTDDCKAVLVEGAHSVAGAFSKHGSIPVAVAVTDPVNSDVQPAPQQHTLQQAVPIHAARRGSQTAAPVVSKKFSDSF